MPLNLVLGTEPKGLEVRTRVISPLLHIVLVGEYQISMPDFLMMAEYVLTNSDLERDDMRRRFVKTVQSMQEVEGDNLGKKRLQSVESPASDSSGKPV